MAMPFGTVGLRTAVYFLAASLSLFMNNSATVAPCLCIHWTKMDAVEKMHSPLPEVPVQTSKTAEPTAACRDWNAAVYRTTVKILDRHAGPSTCLCLERSV